MRAGEGRVDQRCLASRGDDVLIVAAACLANRRRQRCVAEAGKVGWVEGWPIGHSLATALHRGRRP